MSKWNKRSKQLQVDVLQHQQKRKQMILEVARLRQSKDKKLKEQVETVQKQVQQAMKIIFKNKQQVFSQNSRTNIQNQINQRKKQTEIKTMIQWKKKQDVRLEKANQLFPKYNVVNREPTVQSNRQEQIQQVDGSIVLDRLDLDFNGIITEKQYNRPTKNRKNIQQANEEVEKDYINKQLRQLIEYESYMGQTDQQSMKQNINTSNKINSQFEQQKLLNNQQKYQKFTKNVDLPNNQGQQIFDQTIEQTEQAERQFSNSFQIIKQIVKDKCQPKQILVDFNQKIQLLFPQKQVTTYQRQKQQSKKNIKYLNNQTEQLEDLEDKQIITKLNNKNPKIRIRNATKSVHNNRPQSIQNDKSQNKKNQTHEHFLNVRKTVSPLPNIQPIIPNQKQQFTTTLAFHNKMKNLNQQQKRLQQQIRNIHIINKDKIKQIIQKHNIKINYKHSKQIINGDNLNNIEVLYANNCQQLTEDEIEESLQNLDNYLIKMNEDKTKKDITKQISTDCSKEIIQPFINPLELQYQILQLAENVSRFQNLNKIELLSRNISSKGKKNQEFNVKQETKNQLYNPNLNHMLKTQALSSFRHKNKTRYQQKDKD